MAAPLSYATPSFRRYVRPAFPWCFMLAVAGVLSVASFVVVLKGASDEPYMGGVTKSDAIVQVGIGCVLIALWAVWCVAAVCLAVRNLLTPIMLVLTLWAGICVFYLAHGVDGYLSDVIASEANL